MKDILVSFPQYRAGGHDSMSIYHSSIKEELASLGWNVLEAIPQNYENILSEYSSRFTFIRRLAFSFVRTTRSWVLEYWLFLFCISAYRLKAPLIAISQEYVPVFYKNRSIVIVHDMIQQIFPRSTLARLFYTHLIPWALKKCAAVVSVSKTTQTLLMNYGITSSVVYNHIDIDEHHTQHTDNITKVPSTVLWVGTAAKHKSLETLLNAAIEIPTMTFNIVLPERDAHLTPTPSSNVNLCSDLSNRKLRELYLRSEVFVSTSLDEGYGRPAMEARILGCKLILSDLPIYKELHGNFASFFPPKDSSKLISALTDCMNNNNNNNNNVDKSDLSSRTATKDELAKEISNLALKTIKY